MKLTSFHLDGSRVFLAPIGPGLNVVHCPTGDRAATVSDSLRAVLFGELSGAGWPTPDGHLIGSVDLTDETGSGRVSRRRVGHGPGPLEVSLHDGRSQSLQSRLDGMARSAAGQQIVDFGDGHELSAVAIKACIDRLEAQPNWREGYTDHQWEQQRRRLLERERELNSQLTRWIAERDSYQHSSLRGGSYGADPAYRSERLAQLTRQQEALRYDLSQLEQRLRQAPQTDYNVDSRLRAIDAQVHRIEQVCDDVDARQEELHRRMLQHEQGDYSRVEHALDELREHAVALERQLAWLDNDRETMRKSYDADRWDIESSELRRTVSDLVDSINRQEQSLTLETLRIEAKQLRRCRNTLRQQLRRLLEQRDIVARNEQRLYWDAPSADWGSWERQREQLLDELRTIEGEMRTLRRAEPVVDVAWPPAELTSRIAATERELADVRSELATVKAPEPIRDYAALHRAAQLLSRISEGELVTLRYDAPASTLFVVDYEGKPHASYDLPLDVQRLVALSLLLAVADKQFPVVLDRIFEETPETATASILEVLRDSCRDGLQVVAIVYDNEVANRLQRMQIDIRHADWAAPQGREVEFRDATRRPYPVYYHDQHEPARRASTAADARWVTPHRVVSSTAPIQTDVWDTAVPHPYTGRPTLRRTVDQTSRIFEDSHRPAVQAEAHSHRHHLDYADSVTRIPYFGRDVAERLEQYGYWTVADFIRGDAQEMTQQLRGDSSVSEIRNWQAQCQMMCGIARLRPFDAKILVACGITDPLQLQETDPVRLMRRVREFLETPAGRHLVRSGTPFEISRIQRWIESARVSGSSKGDNRTGRYARRVSTANKTGSRGSDRSSRSRTRKLADTSREFTAERAGREYEYDREYDRDRYAHERSYTSQAYNREEGGGEDRDYEYEYDRDRQQRRQRQSRSTRRSNSRSSRSRRSRTRTTPSPSQTSAGRSARLLPRETASHDHPAPTSGGQVLTFYLDMNSDVEAAPTIGPKTAELLYEIGIHTVGHLLESTPSEVAEQLNHPRINANNVLEWQLQSALVCRVPELRGHDSQILVACGVTEPEQLANYDPRDLWAIVAPFIDTKAGQRIVRGGRAPDLDEVTQWIHFANHARQLKAA
ncbi:MAG: DUF4332 domain-containing protein [Planctomycetales bacterium]|nr:DUF4332 domain-containing protein [Planctomycetales bacterium]